jgi:hypothetical protein
MGGELSRLRGPAHELNPSCQERLHREELILRFHELGVER